MKAVWVAIILLILTTSLVTINSIIVGNMLSRVEEMVSDVDIDELGVAEEEYNEILKEYKRYSKFIAFSVKHSEIQGIEELLYELIGACKAGEISDAIEIKSRLVGALSHTRRLAGINYDSVF